MRTTLLRATSLALTLSLAATAAGAQHTADHPRVAEAIHLLETWLDAQLDYENIPGISAGVVSDQELVWAKGFGYANLERMTPATPATGYSICSISKLFTGIGVMQLRDEGKLRLDDAVGSLLPWFDLEQSFPDRAPITVQGILTHSSGLPRESDYPYWTDPFPFPTREQMIERLANQETLYPAWQYFQYSNLGLTLAGEIVSQVSGYEYDDYVRRHILDPLGMTSTATDIGDVWDDARTATGYSAVRRDGKRKTVERFAGRSVAPAMGFASTVEDLARFASWQFRLLENGGHELLDANTLREMQRVHWMDPGWETTRGLAFGVWRNDDKTFVGHGGGCPGFLTRLQLQPDDRIATITMVNANGTNPGLMAIRAHEIMTPALLAARDATDDAQPLAHQFRKYVGAYDGYPWGGESAVIPWKGKLAVVSFPTSNPLGGMMKLEHVEGDRFRRVRDDETLGEEIWFETDAAGTVLRMWQHSNSSERITR